MEVPSFKSLQFDFLTPIQLMRLGYEGTVFKCAKKYATEVPECITLFSPPLIVKSPGEFLRYIASDVSVLVC